MFDATQLMGGLGGMTGGAVSISKMIVYDILGSWVGYDNVLEI